MSKNINILEYLERLLKSLGYDVDEKGKIYLLDDPVIIDKKEVYLPTKWAKNNITENVNGVAMNKYRLFNPFQDDMGGNNRYVKELFRTLATIIRVNISLMFKAHILVNTGKEVRFPLNDLFYQKLSLRYKSKVNKPIIDEKSIHISEYVDENIAKSGKQPIKLHVRSNYKHKGEVFNSACLLEYPLYHSVLDGEHPTKWRKKDSDILLAMYEALLPEEGFFTYSMNKQYNKLLLLLKVKSKFDNIFIEYRDQIPNHKAANLVLKGLIVDEDEWLLDNLEAAYESSSVLPTDKGSSEIEEYTNDSNNLMKQAMSRREKEKVVETTTPNNINESEEEEYEIVYDLVGRPIKKVKKNKYANEEYQQYQQPVVQPPVQQEIDITKMLLPQQPVIPNIPYQQPMIMQGYQQPNIQYQQPNMMQGIQTAPNLGTIQNYDPRYCYPTQPVKPNIGW